MCLCAMGLSACSLDEVRQDIDALENRVAALEEWQASLNSDILALKQLVAGLEERNLITSVTPVLEQGVEVGYRITFQTGDPIVIYHGEDSSYIPLFGVAENDAGDYCWTLDGEFIKDKDGNLIPASSGIAPQVRINSDKYGKSLPTEARHGNQPAYRLQARKATPVMPSLQISTTPPIPKA